MNEIEYERMQEEAGMGQAILENLKAILSDDGAGDTLADLYRSIYKHTDCGPWLSVVLHDGSTVDCDELGNVKLGDVRSLLVGSIVEGSDAEVTADPIDLMSFDKPEDAVEAFNRAVEWVNDEACALWEEANGDEIDEDINMDTPYWITSEQWSRDCIQATADEVRQQAAEWARGSDTPAAEITDDGEYLYADGARIGQLVKPE